MFLNFDLRRISKLHILFVLYCWCRLPSCQVQMIHFTDFLRIYSMPEAYQTFIITLESHEGRLICKSVALYVRDVRCMMLERQPIAFSLLESHNLLRVKWV